MAAENHARNDSRVRIFQEKTAPTDTRLAGWAALVQTFGVQAPVRRPSAISEQHVKASRRVERGWNVFDKRYWQGESFGDQLGFALRHEDIDLLVLKRLFEAVPQDTVTAFVRSAPTGAPNRRAWFFYSSSPAERSTFPTRRRRVSPIFWMTAFISLRRRGSPVVTRSAIICSARLPSALSFAGRRRS